MTKQITERNNEVFI